MVGSAQYRDEEIGWVLSAVVNRKNQEYIQRNFEEMFNRPLNHNQIRYIKNKYGKDPKFNSPLVNIRPSRTATSPPASVLGLGDQEDDAISIATSTASERQRRQSRSRAMTPQMGGQHKRKRDSVDDGRGSSTQHVAKIQRPDVQPHPQYTRVGSTVPNTPQWTTVGIQPTASLHSGSPPQATPNSMLAPASMYDTMQHLVQGTGGHPWVSSMNRNLNMWNLGEPSSLISANRQSTPVFLQNASSSQDGLNYYPEQTPASYNFLSPPSTYHHNRPQVSQSVSMNMPSPSPFSSQIPQSMQSTFSPDYGRELQPQLLPQSQHQIPAYTPTRMSVQLQPQPQLELQPQPQTQPEPQYIPNQGVSGNQISLEANNIADPLPPDPVHDPAMELPAEPPVAEPVPSLDEIPILPSDYTHSPGGTPYPWAVQYGPFEHLPFDNVVGPMIWPFENVRNVGLTSQSSVDIRKQVRDRERREREALAAPQRPDLSIPGHVGQDLSLSTMNTSLQMLNMAKLPTPPRTSPVAQERAEAAFVRALKSCLGAESTPRTDEAALATTATMTTTMTQSQKVQEVAFTGTIDPQLLTDQHISTFSLPTQHTFSFGSSLS